MIKTSPVIKILNTNVYTSIKFDACVRYQLSKHNNNMEM